MMTLNCRAGHDVIVRSGPDGAQLPISDRDTQFVRGDGVTQDWVHLIDLLTGTVGTLVVYTRKSGVAEATGYVKHTLTAPVIHDVRLRFTQGGYAVCTFSFECRFPSDTATIDTVWAITDAQAAPTHLTSSRGGWRIVSAVHGSQAIYHLTGFEYGLTGRIDKACNDGDLGYTAVDLELFMTPSGSISLQDASIATNALVTNGLLLAAAADLVITVKQSGSAANKVVTIANVIFTGNAEAQGNDKGFNDFSLAFEQTDDPDTPLTLTGDNKIITIA